MMLMGISPQDTNISALAALLIVIYFSLQINNPFFTHFAEI
jgi:hypothetical protein